MSGEQVGDRVEAVDQRLFAQRAARIRVRAVGVGAVGQQPLDAPTVVGADRVAQQVVERIDPEPTADALAGVGPHAPRGAAAVALGGGPEELEPDRVVAGQ
ncbi:MAG: hypothetical protein ABI781_02650 [Burkholderiales bacterium]